MLSKESSLFSFTSQITFHVNVFIEYYYIISLVKIIAWKDEEKGDREQMQRRNSCGSTIFSKNFSLKIFLMKKHRQYYNIYEQIWEIRNLFNQYINSWSHASLLYLVSSHFFSSSLLFSWYLNHHLTTIATTTSCSRQNHRFYSFFVALHKLNVFFFSSSVVLEVLGHLIILNRSSNQQHHCGNGEQENHQTSRM